MNSMHVPNDKKVESVNKNNSLVNNKNSFSPALYLLRVEKSWENVNILTNAIIEDIINSNDKKDMDRKIGSSLIIKSLERDLFRSFRIFKELSRLSLWNIKITPVKNNDEFLLAIALSFPPRIEQIKTPEEHMVANFIQGWIIDNNIKTVCPIVIVNSETYFLSNT